MTGNCGFAEGVIHLHGEACYQAGLADGRAAVETPAGGRAPVDGVAPGGSEPTSPPAGLTATELEALSAVVPWSPTALGDVVAAVEQILAERSVRLGLLGDGETCHRCGGENVTWSAPSPLWNKVMRGNDIDGDARYRDLVCIRCFIVLAFETGIEGRWRVSVDPEPEGLIYETPSGRIWDADSWLWKDPTDGEPCTEETWSWVHYSAEVSDPYWIRCTRLLPHDEHGDDGNSGLTWTTPGTTGGEA